jgi:hypothetical protein
MTKRPFGWPPRFGIGSTVIFYVDGAPQGAVTARVLRIVDSVSETLELEVHLRTGAEKAIAKRATHPRSMCTWDFIA